MSRLNSSVSLGTRPIGKLLMEYAIPSIIAMTAASLYNMIDSIFIGHGVGPLAISGLALTFPLINLGAAFGSLVGVGASTLVSVRLGQRDYDTAQRVLGNVVVLNLLIGLAYMVPLLLFLDPILHFFGGSDATVPYAREYMQIILLGNVVTHLYLGLNAVLRASGHPRRSMMATIFTVVLNTVLDPLFIYVFDWGIRGAAIATVLSQLVVLLWQFKLFCNPGELLHFHRGVFRLRRKIVTDSLLIGLAPFLMNLAATLIVILINRSLKTHGGDLAIGAYGIVNRLAFFILMIVIGLNQGMQPIAGYNYGAGLYDRVKKVLLITIVAATVVTTTGFLVGQFCPELAVSLFTSDEALKALSAHALGIVTVCFPLIGFQMVTSNFFQNIGIAGKSIFLSLTRQVLILIPCLLIFPQWWGQMGVWVSLPVSDFMASLIAGTMLCHQLILLGRAKVPER